jgi:dimethylargininase
MLRDCGADVITLHINPDQPDSTFIEDTAVVLDEIAVLASMGTASRQMEPAGIESELRKFREVRHISPPATLEGGDVLHVGKTLIVGLSARTNAAGVKALETIVHPLGYHVQPISLYSCLHLKTACAALPDGRLLVNQSSLDTQALYDFECVCLPAGEPWAANSLLINGRICMAAGFPRTSELLSSSGFEVRCISLSEFAKVEGGVTCLSLLLNE